MRLETLVKRHEKNTDALIREVYVRQSQAVFHSPVNIPTLEYTPDLLSRESPDDLLGSVIWLEEDLLESLSSPAQHPCARRHGTRMAREILAFSIARRAHSLTHSLIFLTHKIFTLQARRCGSGIRACGTSTRTRTGPRATL